MGSNFDCLLPPSFRQVLSEIFTTNSQINTNQAESIYSEALKDISKEDIVIDAFCGVGTLTCLAAKKVRSLICV